MAVENFSSKVSFIWSVADLIRGPYRPNQYKDVMLPLTVLRRLDCVLEPTKDKVLTEHKALKDKGKGILEAKLMRITGVPFYNTSKFTFEKLKGAPNEIASNLVNFMKGFSDKARSIIDCFAFEEHITKLQNHDRLFLVVQKFAEIDLHPDTVPNYEMGLIFEELIRKFNEASNEEAGDHFTPREVIRLMVDLLFTPDKDILTKKGIVRTLCDPAMGTGGMLSVSEDYLKELNPDARLEVFGQDYNPQSYAVAGSDMLIKGQEIEHIVFDNSFTDDGFEAKKFDYMLANPPFGVKWETEQSFIQKEADEKGFSGRFGAGLPRINDGSFLFLQHMISKMKPVKEGGTRLAIVFNGSPLFTGGAGSGESDIRRWVIENDWLEAIVALPDQLFYNTGISTYLWIITNRKEERRKGKVQLIDATSFFSKMKKSLGNKRNEVTLEHKDEIVKLYGLFKQGQFVKIFNNDFFGYTRITVERPLKLNYAVTTERLGRLKQTSRFQALAETKKHKDKKSMEKEIAEGKKLQDQILTALSSISNGSVLKSKGAFQKLVDKALDKGGLTLKASLHDAIIDALSYSDQTAEVCTFDDGTPMPDPELRDYENVPLGLKTEDYMKKEVLPFVPDAWVDTEKNRIGYEIGFNSYFYVYEPPRPVEEIEKDLETIEEEILFLLKR